MEGKGNFVQYKLEVNQWSSQYQYVNSGSLNNALVETRHCL